METKHTGNRRGQRSRDEILEAASRLMAERGYAATSLGTLSTETGLPKSAIYHHFRSKGGLLSAVMDRGLSEFFTAMDTALADPPASGSPRERLTWFLQQSAAVLEGSQEFLRLHMLLILSAEAADETQADTSATIGRIRRDGRLHVNRMIRDAFADKGDDVAQRIADALTYFGMAGIDGAFIATQAEEHRSMAEEMELLAEALALLGEQLATRSAGD